MFPYKRFLHFVLIIIFAGCPVVSSYAAVIEEAATAENIALTGDWGGARTALANRGIELDADYKADVMSNVSGGRARGTAFLDNLDVVFELEGEKLGAKGFSGKIYFLNNDGSRPGADLVGDAEGIDNIEVPAAGARLFEAWVQQEFLKNRFSVLAGLYDLNSEFYVTPSSLLFLRPTFAIGTEMAMTGRNGPSIFPFTSVGLRFKVLPTDDFSFQTAVLDGVPGDPDNPKGTHIELRRSDGALVVAEADYEPRDGHPSGKTGIGAWTYTRKMNDLTAVDSSGNPIPRLSYGGYLIIEHLLYQEPANANRSLTAFAHFGFANGDVNRFEYAWSAGVVAHGLVPGRPASRLGLGVEGAHNSVKFRRSVSASDALTGAIELTYGDDLTPWLTVQPDIQYIVNPGTNSALKNAVVVGSRFTARF